MNPDDAAWLFGGASVALGVTITLTILGSLLCTRVEVQGGAHTSVRPYVLYEYSLVGQRHEGQQIRAGDKIMSSYTSRQAYDTVDLYPVGSEVTVYYDPSNPAESALTR